MGKARYVKFIKAVIAHLFCFAVGVHLGKGNADLFLFVDPAHLVLEIELTKAL